MTTTVETYTPSVEVRATSDQPFRDQDSDRVNELPPPLLRSTTTNSQNAEAALQRRHSKRLSLNFPIFVPPAQDSPRTGNGSLSSWSQSPTMPSPYRLSTQSTGAPFPSPDELRGGFNPLEGPDFLTLIAGQERRVMELKEELVKAETVLISLKKQWALFEAKKKQSEINDKTVKMGPVSTQAAPGAMDELERAKRREAREQKMRDLGMTEGDLARSNSTNGRKNGGRVFAGKHARTLSLLQNNNNNSSAEPQTTTGRPSSKTESSVSSLPSPDILIPDIPRPESNHQEESKSKRHSLSKQPTLQELIASSATGAAQMNFGKTYKDLTQASRKSLPPGTDIFVKQGKQVYDGVSQGFWNFVEDIRQATVGDEAVNGAPIEPRKEVKKTRSTKKLNEQQNCNKHGKGGKNESNRRQRNGDEHKPDKDNFWKEFGIETPKNPRRAETNTSRKTSNTKSKEDKDLVKDHESKSSTDSKCPPSLLADLMDVHEDDEAWDNWPVESPASHRHSQRRVGIRRGSEDEEEDLMSQEASSVGTNFPKKTARHVDASWVELTS